MHPVSRAPELKKYLSVGKRLGVTKKGKQVRKREQGGIYARSNLQVARNRRFVIKTVYIFWGQGEGGGTMVVKILDFKLFESLKSARTFAFRAKKLPLY